ncbi:UNVERIFIED_CONTAM: hypothetical protein FKN15_038777 [Acipenser sinensis]
MGDLNYEVRRYDGGTFATVNVDGKSFDETSGEAVLKLLKYVGGSNDKGIGMGMTAPVSITAFPKEDGSLSGKLNVGIRIPTKFQSDPPSPTDETVKIEQRSGMTVYSMDQLIFASLAHQHTQRLRCWLRGSTIVRPPQRISMTTVWIELSRVHLWGLQVGTFHPQCFVD